MRVGLRYCGFCVMLLAMLSTSVPAQSLAKRGWQGSGLTVEKWWESATFYQLDPLTFQDTKGNGFGDLRGVTQHLDYLQSLQVDALILSPLPLEPAGPNHAGNAPFDAAYGTEEDLDLLVQEASSRRMRILVDLPFDSTLSGEETANAARFWFSRGIAGLRLTRPDPRTVPLTAAQTSARLAELEGLCSSFPGKRVLFWDLPEETDPHALPAIRMRRSAAHSRSAQRRSAHKATPLSPAAATGGASVAGGPQLVLDGRLLQLDCWQAGDFARLLTGRPQLRFPLARPVIASDASNLRRSFDRFSDGEHAGAIAKQAAALLLLGQAVPELYAGQEIGIETAPGAPLATPAAAAAPSPMPWGGTPGFTSGIPWVPPGPNAATANVASEEGDKDSLLNWYRSLSRLRRTYSALRGGSLAILATEEAEVVAWIRRPPQGVSGGAAIVVVCNLSSHARVASLAAELRARELAGGTGLLRTLASSTSSTDASAPMSLKSIALPAYGVYVGELRLQPGLESAPAPAQHKSGHRSGTPSTSGE